ncbi:hypothetical protein [Streptomyces sp. URMC 123]|uniref:hypothetical protein n=1 Tax=Streptomyces sp. URMC 123 TaxID=3423403 RepID=UPI003F198277
MTALHLADAGEAADLAAFLARLIHYDRAAAVRLQVGAGGPPRRAPGPAPTGGPESPAPTGGPESPAPAERVLAVFGRPASFEVLAIRTARIAADPASSGAAPLDVTVSAGQLADAIDTALAAGPTPPAAPAGDPAPPAPVPVQAAPPSGSARPAGGLVVTVPPAVTGPPWAGVLPPRGGWQRVPGLPGPDAIRAAVAASVAEFRARTEALPADRRTRAELDRIGRELWSRTLGDTGLPLRAVHAAQSLGFLRPAATRAAAGAAHTAHRQPAGGAARTAVLVPEAEAPALFASGGWLRLRTPYGSIAVRRAGLGALPLSPTPRRA